jgi:hypothetical protein
MFATFEYVAVYQCCKIPCLNFGAHCGGFVSIYCHLKNGFLGMYPLEGKTGGGRRVPYLSCEQGGVKQSIPF